MISASCTGCDSVDCADSQAKPFSGPSKSRAALHGTNWCGSQSRAAARCHSKSRSTDCSSSRSTTSAILPTTPAPPLSCPLSVWLRLAV